MFRNVFYCLKINAASFCQSLSSSKVKQSKILGVRTDRMFRKVFYFLKINAASFYVSLSSSKVKQSKILGVRTDRMFRNVFYFLEINAASFYVSLSHLQRSSSPKPLELGLIGCPETSFTL